MGRPADPNFPCGQTTYGFHSILGRMINTFLAFIPPAVTIPTGEVRASDVTDAVSNWKNNLNEWKNNVVAPQLDNYKKEKMAQLKATGKEKYNKYKAQMQKKWKETKGKAATKMAATSMPKF